MKKTRTRAVSTSKQSFINYYTKGMSFFKTCLFLFYLVNNNHINLVFYCAILYCYNCFTQINKMKHLLLALSIILLFACNSQSDQKQSSESMNVSKDQVLQAFLEVNDRTVIPFLLSKKEKDNFLIVKNGSEEIKVNNFTLNENILEFEMPVFNSKISSKKINGSYKGEWDKLPDSEKPYKMVFHAFAPNEVPEHFKDERLEMYKNEKLSNINGTWAVEFSPSTEDAYPAIGEFKQNGNIITGTFMTETGDYRFLAGEIYGNQFSLSCFDGSHAFLFKGSAKGKKIQGTFYSGNHWEEPWVGNLDPEISLEDPYKLTTYQKEKGPFNFSFQNLKAQKIEMKKLLNGKKGLLVQIFGSWCPNCMDETALFTELYNDYRKKGIEFVGIGFERKGDLEKDKIALQKYIKHFDIHYPILYGGKASKTLASEKFPMLNKIISFPTSILLDANGAVVQIHTGFNGPATSKYQAYKNNLLASLDKLAE